MAERRGDENRLLLVAQHRLSGHRSHLCIPSPSQDLLRVPTLLRSDYCLHSRGGGMREGW
ncbi:hypothetical protein PVAG01_00839 [Phlyctema vagabunda]|uniref:Uncharacterized protein n=1 Tax=Phlyctema vagabunda TaxID=108571 RepID=A0ABR4PVD4_9HELO